MVDMSEYKIPVHRSLLQREMMGGIPQAGLFVVFMLGIIFVYGLKSYFFGSTLVAILYLVMRHLTKEDQWFIDMILENITQKDKLIP